MANEPEEQGRRSDRSRSAGTDLLEHGRRGNGPRRAQVRVGNHARHTRRQVRQQKDRKGCQVDVTRGQSQAFDKRLVLGHEEAVRADGCPWLAGAAARERHDRRCPGVARHDRCSLSGKPDPHGRQERNTGTNNDLQGQCADDG